MNDQKQRSFKVLSATFDSEAEESLKESVQNHFYACSSLQRLIFDWVDTSRSVLVCNADCDPGEEEAFLIMLNQDEVELAQIAVSMNWLREEYPGLSPATDWEFDEDERTKGTWCKVVCDYALSEQDNLKIMASYLLTEYSTISFESPGSWLYEDCFPEELESLQGRSLISVNPHYMNSKTGEGFGENRWALKAESEQML